MPNIHPISFCIVRITDRAGFEAARRLFAAIGDDPNKVQVRLMVGRQNRSGHREDIQIEFPQPFAQVEIQDEKLKACLDLEGYYVRQFEFHAEGRLSLTLTRNYDFRESRFTRPDDTINVTFHHEDEVKALETVKAIRLHFKSADENQLPEQVGDDLKRYYSVRENNVQKLEDKLGELVSKLADYAIQNERELLQKKQTLDEAHRQRLAELEEERKKLHAEYEERRKALDDRAAKINDRENVHERRRLYDEIKKQIQTKSTKPELTDHTRGLRKVVWGLSGVLGLFLLTVFVICFKINLTEEKVNWVAIGSQITSGATLLGLAAFVIRWQNRWFQTHADEEYRLKRMELDIERASWLVELALEWFTETKAPIPQELMDKLAARLFTANGEPPLDMSPLESLRTGMLGKHWRILLEPAKLEAQSGKTNGPQ